MWIVDAIQGLGYWMVDWAENLIDIIKIGMEG